jgi:hypothetical protein
MRSQPLQRWRWVGRQSREWRRRAALQGPMLEHSQADDSGQLEMQFYRFETMATAKNGAYPHSSPSTFWQKKP